MVKEVEIKEIQKFNKKLLLLKFKKKMNKKGGVNFENFYKEKELDKYDETKNGEYYEKYLKDIVKTRIDSIKNTESQYVVTEYIGQGNFAYTFKGYDIKNDKIPYAIKVFKNIDEEDYEDEDNDNNSYNSIIHKISDLPDSMPELVELMSNPSSSSSSSSSLSSSSSSSSLSSSSSSSSLSSSSSSSSKKHKSKKGGTTPISLSDVFLEEFDSSISKTDEFVDDFNSETEPYKKYSDRVNNKLKKTLCNKYLLKLIDYGLDEQNNLILVMDYFDGLNIEKLPLVLQKMKERPLLKFLFKKNILLNIQIAIFCIHSNFFIHNDIKDDNILFNFALYTIYSI